MIRAIVVASVWSTVAVAQTGKPIPIRQLAPAVPAADSVRRGALRVWESSDRSVLTNMRSSMRGGLLVQSDSLLGGQRVVADSGLMLGGTVPFGGFVTLPYRGDTLAFVDGLNSSIVLLDKTGKQTRVMALPHTRDMMEIATGYNWTQFDPQGRLLYRTTIPRKPDAAPRVPGTFTALDTFALVRADFAARAVDTVATLSIPSGAAFGSTMTDGVMITRTKMMPNPAPDDWAVLADGSIAIVRGHDYHIDWIRADGSRASTAKMPFDWRKLTEGDKQHLIDSLKAYYGPMDARMDSMRMRASAGRGGTVMRTERSYAEPSEIPDYYAPIRANALFTDPDNRLWILPTTSSEAVGGLLYDVVNTNGEIVERVQLPRGSALAAVGAHDVVILRMLDANGVTWRLARTHIIRPKIAQNAP